MWSKSAPSPDDAVIPEHGLQANAHGNVRGRPQGKAADLPKILV